MGLKLKNIDMGNIEAATAALNLFSEAAERAAAAIDALDRSQHGGVAFVSAGGVAKLDVKPQETISGMALASIIYAVKIAISADKVRRGVAL